jgi:TetR/AcrR family transcriptional regulator, cholesterol catabolism regulator
LDREATDVTKVRDLDQVLEVAARVFGERGYEAARLDEIAEELGILKGSLYHYTSSKAELLYLVNRKRLEVLLERATEVAAREGPALERLEEILRAHLRSIDEFYPESSQWFVQPESRKPPRVKTDRAGAPRALHHRYEALIAGLIEQGKVEGTVRPDIDTQVSALGVLGACNWLTHWYRAGGRLTIEEVSDSLLALLLDGLRAPERASKRKPSARRGMAVVRSRRPRA